MCKVAVEKLDENKCFLLFSMSQIEINEIIDVSLGYIQYSLLTKIPDISRKINFKLFTWNCFEEKLIDVSLDISIKINFKINMLINLYFLKCFKLNI